ncbi:mpv17-like protein 2 [Patella vulgata]|uniref:mpv17-like protein 2 n=1 Tax=Patella vulgata TaxID=6465 RepID=UPI00217F8F96|nr:mpv17-like protein 2 [Patella vulgata]XP_050399444.1 mpv17-like protein 2 [Patella vulgata]
MMSSLAYRLSPVMKRIANCGRVLFSDKYLLLTNTTISVTLSVTGDIMQQKYQIMQNNMKSWNKKRTFHMACTGLVIGAFCHYWYLYLDKFFPGTAFRTLIKKVLIDQIVCSPIYIGMYFVTIGMLENMTVKEIAAEVLVKGSTIYTMEWIIWPPAQLINFMFLPTKYRVLYDNIISLGFDTYYSNVKYHSEVRNTEVISQSKNIDIETIVNNNISKSNYMDKETIVNDNISEINNIDIHVETNS